MECHGQDVATDPSTAQEECVKTILLVEDDEALAHHTKTTLEKNSSCLIIVASNCAEAYALLKSCRPEFILLDFNLPDGDGGDIATYVRGRPDLADIPIIFVTGLATENDIRNREGRIGEEFFVAKPVSMDGLISLIDRIEVTRLLTGVSETEKFQELTRQGILPRISSIRS
jgi:DNA-binding response OmpR family regulator